MRCKQYDENNKLCLGLKGMPTTSCKGDIFSCEITDYKEEQLKEINHDNVNHPAHYTAGGIECIDALAAATAGLEGIEAVCTANAIKYLWRWKLKNGVEDLKKAIWYINHLIEELDNKG